MDTLRLWYARADACRTRSVLVFERPAAELPKHFVQEAGQLKLADIVLCRGEDGTWQAYQLKLRPERPHSLDVEVQPFALDGDLAILPWCADIAPDELRFGIPVGPSAYAETLTQLRDAGLRRARSFMASNGRARELWHSLGDSSAASAMHAMAVTRSDFPAMRFTRLMPGTGDVACVSRQHSPESMQDRMNGVASAMKHAHRLSELEAAGPTDLHEGGVKAGCFARACAEFLLAGADIERCSATIQDMIRQIMARPGPPPKPLAAGALIFKELLTFVPGAGVPCWSHVPREVLKANARQLTTIRNCTAASNEVTALADYGLDHAKICEGCGDATLFPKRCAKCHTGVFCSKACMEHVWPQHKLSAAHRGSSKAAKA